MKPVHVTNLTFIFKRQKSQKLLIKTMVAFVMLTTVSSCNNDRITDRDLQNAYDKIWYVKSGTSLSELDNINATELNKHDKLIYDMLVEYNHINSNIYNQENYDLTTLYGLATTFASKKNYEMASFAYYTVGLCLYAQSRDQEAIDNYKLSELLYRKSKQHNKHLGGRIYRKIGRTQLQNGLITEGRQNIHTAIEYFKIKNDSMNIGVSYRHLVSSYANHYELEDELIQSYILALIDTSLTYITPQTYYYHDMQYIKAVFQRDTANMVYYAKIQLDSLHLNKAASILADCYIHYNKLDSAKLYLETFAKDTMEGNKNWAVAYYNNLLSRYYIANKQYYEAAYLLQDMYNETNMKLSHKTDQLTSSRNYQFDIEQQQKELIKNTKQIHQLFIIIMIITMILMTSIVAFVMVRYKKKQKEIEQQNIILTQELQIKALEEESATQRQTLRRQLQDRLELTRQYKNTQLKLVSKQEELPEWAKEFVKVNLMSNISYKDTTLKEEINNLYNKILDRIAKEYSNISDADLLLISLIIIGISTTDLPILLDKTPQSVYNHRNLLKNKLNLDKSTDLKEWLITYYKQEKETH